MSVFFLQTLLAMLEKWPREVKKVDAKAMQPFYQCYKTLSASGVIWPSAVEKQKQMESKAKEEEKKKKDLQKREE